MKLFLIETAQTAKAGRATERECSQRIADLVLPFLAGDPAPFGVRHVGESSLSPVPTEARYGDIETVHLADEAVLRTVRQECADPSSGKWMLVRSLVSCRAVLFGHDGQAWVCIPSDEPDIESPNSALISVHERSELLTTTDWMDGLLSV